MENEYNTNMSIGEVILCIILIIMLILSLFILCKDINNEQIMNSEIIKQSKGYTVFEECIEIQDNWYCK